MYELSLEYFSLVFLAAMGVLQAAAGHGERTRFFFFKQKVHGYFFGALTVAPAMTGFFTWNYRNPTGIIEGTQQFFLFLFAVGSAMLMSALITQFVKSTVIMPDKYGLPKGVKGFYHSKKYQDDRSV